MNKLLLAGLFVLIASPAFATPYCDVGQTNNGHTDYGFGDIPEQDSAQRFEQELNAEGIAAHQTRFWNGCIQTFVTENGSDVMKFYDPSTLQELH